jgi:L-alanine-DL-glutamate epimerase-like enolase superfamily enzyme
LIISDLKLNWVEVRRETGHLTPHVIVRLSTNEGVTGVGEMSDLSHAPLYDFQVDALEQTLKRLLVGQNPIQIARLNEIMSASFPGQEKASLIRCGVDIALHDLVARYLGIAVCDLLGGRYRDRLRVCYPIFRMFHEREIEANLQRVADRMAQGQDMFRLYCGGNVEVDEAFLQAVRHRWGDRFVLKSLDLSGRLDWKSALNVIRRLEKYSPLLFESVCYSHDGEGMREIRRRTDVPISEHVLSLEHALRLVEARAVDIFNICLVALGGIEPARKVYGIAEAAHLSCLIGTTQELSIGIAAQAHLGAAMPNLNMPSDLTGGLLYLDDVVKERVRYENGYLWVPEGPGLGVEIDEERLVHLEKGTRGGLKQVAESEVRISA